MNILSATETSPEPIYTYQVEQHYIDSGNKFPKLGEWYICATANWKRPYATLEDAIKELDRCDFPGAVIRMAENGWTAGKVYAKKDGNFDYKEARMRSLGVLKDGERLDPLFHCYERVRVFNAQGEREERYYLDTTYTRLFTIQDDHHRVFQLPIQVQIRYCTLHSLQYSYTEEINNPRTLPHWIEWTQGRLDKVNRDIAEIESLYFGR